MHSALLIFCGCVLVCSFNVVVPARILFLYPIPFRSHYRAFSPLIEELANRGHQITAFTSFGRQRSTKNYREISININTSSITNGGWETVSWRSKSSIAFIHGLWDFFTPFTEAALQSEELQALIHSEENFDLVIVEATFMEESLLAFGRKFNAPVVNLCGHFVSPYVAQLVGIPHSYSYIPSVFLHHTDHMTFWQRVKNTLVGTYHILAGNYYYLPLQERMMRRYFNYSGSETLPPLMEMLTNVSLHLVDSHQQMNSVRPYSPNVIDVAGMAIKPAGELPQDLKKFMDEATDGVIYLSFGTYIDARSFSKEFNAILVETLKGVKQRVIMKWSEKVDNAPHIFTKSWLPQQEILAHPNCKLFITHGGYNGLMEATSAGVPILGIPFFSDQYHNIAYREQQGAGLELGYESISVSEFRHKIDTIIRTPSFGENAKRLATIFRDQPQTSLEKAVYWVEYVIRHKGAHHLKPASVKMPYYQYLLLDVIAFLAMSVISVVYILYRFIRKIMLFECVNSVSQAKKRK